MHTVSRNIVINERMRRGICRIRILKCLLLNDCAVHSNHSPGVGESDWDLVSFIWLINRLLHTKIGRLNEIIFVLGAHA